MRYTIAILALALGSCGTSVDQQNNEATVVAPLTPEQTLDIWVGCVGSEKVFRASYGGLYVIENHADCLPTNTG